MTKNASVQLQVALFRERISALRLTRIRLQPVSGDAGGDPLAVLTVDGGALQAVEAATRLLCDRVFGPFRETFNCRSKRTVCYHKGPWRIAARSVLAFVVKETRRVKISVCGLTWVTVLLLEAARLFGPAGLIFSMAASSADGRVRICAVRKHVES